MNWNGILETNHKGGSLVFVPYDNLIYCIAGINTSIVETINIYNNPEYHKKINKTFLSEPRAYFGTFVQNDSVIYVILGYNYMKNDFMSVIERLDTKGKDKTWKELYFTNDFRIPKLVFISCIPSSANKLHVLGGVDENYYINRIIYIVHIGNDNNFEIEESNMGLPFEEDSQKIVTIKDNNKGFTCLFYQENTFVPLRTPDVREELLFGLFDSKHNLHLANLSNFNYCIIARKEEKESQNKNEFLNNVNNPEDDFDYIGTSNNLLG